MIRQQLSLNFGTNAQLPVDTLMQASFLKHQVILDRHTGKIRHQLHVAAMHVCPDQ